jgi:hypothetical protein
VAAQLSGKSREGVGTGSGQVHQEQVGNSSGKGRENMFLRVLQLGCNWALLWGVWAGGLNPIIKVLQGEHHV